MSDYLSHGNIGFTNLKASDFLGDVESKDGADPKNKAAFIWNTKKIRDILEQYDNGEIDIRGMKNTPFYDNDPVYRKHGIRYEYTKEEMKEISRCKNNVMYFADKYAQSMTDEGIVRLDLRPYQREILYNFNNHRFNILMAARQSGKTVTAAIFLVWFALFHAERNVLLVADVSDTTKELMEKVKAIVQGLPFFMKPGMVTNNVMTIKFSNGSRIIGRTTTKKTGIGFSIHLLYMDEFAHIDPSYLNYFYRSIYPTISGMPNSKVIITSTPNGTNRFHTLWEGALAGIENGGNSYHPMRVDWWQVPGRDEKWREETIANLGSVEDFNQEYNLQFFSGDSLLMGPTEMRKMHILKTTYQTFNWDLLERDDGDVREYFQFHPDFIKKYLKDDDDLRYADGRFIISIDTADGKFKDYSVINIFKLVTLPINILNKHKHRIKEENDIFALMQVGMFRTNKVNINVFSEICSDIIFRFFDPEYVRVVLEMNHKGEVVNNMLKQHGDYYPGLLVHTKHNVSAKYFTPGILIGNDKAASKYAENVRDYAAEDKIIINEDRTVMEVNSFGKNKSNLYRCQLTNDDCAKSSMNATAFFGSPQFYEFCEDAYDEIEDDGYLDKIEVDFIEYNQDRDERGHGMDVSYLQSLNS